MKITIKIDNIDVKKCDFDRINSKLEEILKIKPNGEIKEISQKMNWPINQKNVFIKGNKSREQNKVYYRIEFSSNNKEEGKNYHIGEMNYYLKIKN
jgi:hypothetical protein